MNEVAAATLILFAGLCIVAAALGDCARHLQRIARALERNKE